MKESEIRNRAAHNRYLELVQEDAARLARDRSQFLEIDCPACGGSKHQPAFTKAGFTYAACADCETLFVTPRPTFASLVSLYGDSPSTEFWVKEFFTPMAEARREKIFRPRARYVAQRFAELERGRIGDVGAGFGLFLEELRAVWPSATAVAIEPSVDMAEILRGKQITVIQEMLENIPAAEADFDLLTAFELFEHLHDPLGFLRQVRDQLRPGGYFYLTTLNGQGFDIQLFWEGSKSVSPPHHLNFINPKAMTILLERAGFEVLEVSTPGELDWDIVEGGWRAGEGDPGRFFQTVARHGTAEAKVALQAWIRDHGFSSHLRAVARRPA